ncbi:MULTISPECIES: CDP-diacylglycerol--serine O-phosphatidyltransferase [unclassified Nocardioides]|uniref:CDP-diacylglycerol--serine O-phosphatidyltransferase n=1 Tax=unclassified Nocardioides TaxID=2615069 RepID=UPI0006F76B31|nr:MULTISPECIES: CDP-diacylglycerol--serine O-phosphatidyltransferase [unclassified Nocardioides]KQY57592.1 CDP-diacylglycerol O-phosphatidyltransferase [Nocardioides sp. Root140]KRF15112.1 CDP-diacylglycerol O-phosphatidyltransferase [Nocardioides sp. Soil796]
MTDSSLRRRLLRRWRLESHSGAEVVSLRQLSAREQLRVTSPSLFTTANMGCGFSSVLLATSGHFQLAAILIAVAIVMDIADGAVARLVGATSPFGVQLDSLADLVSFGLAPAVLVYTWVLPEWPVIAWLAAFFWLACAGFRLARFNFTIDPTDDKRYFIGLPSPAAAAVVMATVFAMDNPDVAGPDFRVGPAILVPVAISLVPALLMVSTVRFRSFRDLVTPRTTQTRVCTTVAVLVVAAGLALAPATTGVTVAYLYVATAPLGVLTAPLRARIFGADSVAPPRTRQQSVFLPLAGDEDAVGDEA